MLSILQQLQTEFEVLAQSLGESLPPGCLVVAEACPDDNQMIISVLYPHEDLVLRAELPVPVNELLIGFLDVFAERVTNFAADVFLQLWLAQDAFE